MTGPAERPALADLALDACLLLLSLGAALNLAAAQAGVAGALVLLLWRAIRGDPALRRAVEDLGPVLHASLFFLGAAALSSLVTAAPFPGMFDATRWRPMLAVPVGALALCIRGEVLARRCVMVFAAGCGVHALVGLVQVFTELTPMADILRVPVERRQVVAPGRPDLRSAVGLFYNRVRLSHVLAAGVAASLGMALLVRRRTVVFGGVAVITLLGLVATWGRAALMALVLSVGAAVVVAAVGGDPAQRRRRLLWGAGVLGAVMVLVVIIEPARARLLSALDLSRNADRLFLWSRGVEMAQDHAPYGAGFGGYAVIRDAYYDAVDDSLQSRAMSHNLLLSLLAETGILGLLGWAWMWFELYRRAAWSRHPVALTGALAVTTFHAATMAHDPLYQSESAVAWGLAAAWMVTRGNDLDEGDAV